MGATDPPRRVGTIRKAFATSIEQNAVHGSDSPESAAYEIPYFFGALDSTPTSGLPSSRPDGEGPEQVQTLVTLDLPARNGGYFPLTPRGLSILRRFFPGFSGIPMLIEVSQIPPEGLTSSCRRGPRSRNPAELWKAGVGQRGMHLGRSGRGL